MVTLIVLVAHALLLLGMPHWIHNVPVNSGPQVFQIRLAAAPPDATTQPPSQTQPQPQPQPKPKPVPKPKPKVQSKPAPRPTPLPDATEPSPSNEAETPLPNAAPPTFATATAVATAVANPPTAQAAAFPSLLQAPPSAVFGGTAPARPVAQLPASQALAARQQAAQPNTTILTAPDTITPGTPDPTPSLQSPRPAQVIYQTLITLENGRQTPLFDSMLNWRHDGQSYEVSWRIYVQGFGNYYRCTQGFITQHGLAPLIARATGAGNYDLTFDYTQMRLYSDKPPIQVTVGCELSDSPSSTPAAAASASQPAVTALQAATQDKLSALIELGSLIHGDPTHYPVGSRITLPVANASGQILPTTFDIVDDQAITLPTSTGSHPARHLVHEPTDAADSHIELWVGPDSDYLPLRLITVEPGGTRLEMTFKHGTATALTRQATPMSENNAPNPPNPH